MTISSAASAKPATTSSSASSSKKPGAGHPAGSLIFIPHHNNHVHETWQSLGHPYALAPIRRNFSASGPPRPKQSKPMVHQLQRITGLITRLRSDIPKLSDARAKALFKVSAEVLTGLQKALRSATSGPLL